MNEDLGTTPPPPSGAQLQQLWLSIRKHWRLVLGVATVVTVLVSFYVVGKTKIYRATTTVKIEPVALRPLGDDVQTPGENAESFWWNKEYYETQYRLIRSRKVAEEVARRLGLHRDLGFLQGLPPGATPKPSAVEATVLDAAAIVQGYLEVTPVKSSRLVELSYEDPDPARAKRILSAVTETYIQQNLEAALSNMGSAGDWLNGQLSKLKGELEKSELDLHEYKKTKQLLSVSLDDQSNMLRAEMQQLNTELTGARAKREQLSARVAQLNRVSADSPEELPAAELLQSEVLRGLRSAYLEGRAEQRGLLGAGKGENHPEVMKATATLETAKRALLDEVKNIQESYRRDLMAANGEIGGLSGLYEAAKQKALDLNLLEIEFNRLARTKDNTEKIYGLVLERAKESDLTSQMRFNNIAVVDAPLLPRSPVKPWVSLTVGLGMVGGLALGVAFVFVRERLDRRIKLPTDIEQGVGLSCLGVFPQVDHALDALASPGPKRRRRKAEAALVSAPELHVHSNPAGALAEAARALRTNLVFMSPDEPFRRLLVTSAGPSEGKTTVACCLAITLAQTGKSVLLLDADLRRPRVHQVFGQATGGVTTALVDPSTLDGAIFASTVPNLSILPTGPIPPNPAELLHSASFQRLLETLSTRFDRIVIDSPPLVPVTDAAILSHLVDTTLLVIRGFKTRKDSALEAVRSLRSVNARIAGAILNDVDLRAGEYGYQYYAYRRDGYSSRDSMQPPARP